MLRGTAAARLFGSQSPGALAVLASYLGLAGVFLIADLGQTFVLISLAVLFGYAIGTFLLGRPWMFWLAPVPWLLIVLWLAALARDPLECETCDAGILGVLLTIVAVVIVAVLVVAPVAAIVRLVRHGRRGRPYRTARRSA